MIKRTAACRIIILISISVGILWLNAILSKPNDRGLMSSNDLHRIMDEALANGWEPKKETE